MTVGGGTAIRTHYGADRGAFRWPQIDHVLDGEETAILIASGKAAFSRADETYLRVATEHHIGEVDCALAGITVGSAPELQCWAGLAMEDAGPLRPTTCDAPTRVDWASVASIPNLSVLRSVSHMSVLQAVSRGGRCWWVVPTLGPGDGFAFLIRRSEVEAALGGWPDRPSPPEPPRIIVGPGWLARQALIETLFLGVLALGTAFAARQRPAWWALILVSVIWFFAFFARPSEPDWTRVDEFEFHGIVAGTVAFGLFFLGIPLALAASAVAFLVAMARRLRRFAT